MSVMHPEKLPHWVLADPGRRAEVVVFRKLAAAADRYHVFYSVDWQNLEVRGSSRRREIDFVILDPHAGLIVMEVKGGRIRIEKGQWQYRREGLWKDYDVQPPQQLEDNMQAFRRALLELHSLPKLRVGKALCLPDISKKDIPRSALGPHSLVDVIVDEHDLEDTDARLQALFDYYSRTGQHEALSEQDVERLQKIIVPSFQMTASLNLLIDSSGQAISQLTEQQYRGLRYFESNRKVAVKGAAGTGKTVLALELARRGDQNGMKTLFVCYNKNLAAHLRYVAGSQGHVTISHFHDLHKALRIHPSPGGDWGEAIAAALTDGAAGQFDVVVVDEAQDFEASWVSALERCVGADGQFWVFYDDNQQVYGRDFTDYQSGRFTQWNLSENLRNTQEIFTLARRFYDGVTDECWGPPGLEPQIVRNVPEGSRPEYVLRTIDSLIRERGVKLGQIAVLVENEQEKSKLLADPRFVALPAASYAPGPVDAVVIETFRTFKGLERPVMILLYLKDDPFTADRTLLYVGATRATSHVIILASYATSAAIPPTPTRTIHWLATLPQGLQRLVDAEAALWCAEVAASRFESCGSPQERRRLVSISLLDDKFPKTRVKATGSDYSVLIPNPFLGGGPSTIASAESDPRGPAEGIPKSWVQDYLNLVGTLASTIQQGLIPEDDIASVIYESARDFKRGDGEVWMSLLRSLEGPDDEREASAKSEKLACAAHRAARQRSYHAAEEAGLAWEYLTARGELTQAHVRTIARLGELSQLESQIRFRPRDWMESRGFSGKTRDTQVTKILELYDVLLATSNPSNPGCLLSRSEIEERFKRGPLYAQLRGGKRGYYETELRKKVTRVFGATICRR